MRVAVVGAGAIGSTYAWCLTRAGHDVAVVDVRHDQVDAIRRDGLVADGRGRVEVEAATDAAELEAAKLVLVATKSFATAAAARTAAGLLQDGTLVATVQNGIGNAETLASVLGEHRVLAGTTTVAAEAGGPGRVWIGDSTADGRSLTVLGPHGPAGSFVCVRELRAALTAAGLSADAVHDPQPAVWRKLAFRRLDGPALGGAAPERRGDARRRPHRASMAVDVAEGRRTEIDAMCVEVSRLGRDYGVPTPVNDVIGRLVLALEASSA